MQYERLRDWVESTETGDRAELEFEPSASLWADLAVGADRCQGKRCPLVSSCFSEAARERAGEAELVIVNHALYFADLALRARSDGTGVLPDHDAVVFDEAHRLEEAASAWFGGRVSLARLRQLARDVERSCREAGRVPPARALAALDRMGSSFIAVLEPAEGRSRLTPPPWMRFSTRLSRSARRSGSWPTALTGGGEEAEATPPACTRCRRRPRGMLRSRRPRARLVGGGRGGCVGAGRRVGASRATSSGTGRHRGARLGDARERLRRAARLGLEEPARSSRPLPFDFANRRCSTCRPGSPSLVPARLLRPTRRTRCWRSAVSRAGARSC